MIGIINYGLGNISSFSNILKVLNINYLIVDEVSQLNECDRFILPGVGSFDVAINKIKNLIFFDQLKKKIILEKKKILGVCVGMQVFFDSSEEGEQSGLGWISGNVVRLKNEKNIRIPHMGWNIILKKNENNILKNIPINSEFYFLHSYCCMPKNEENILASSFYGLSFCSVVKNDNIYGVQFHPEKSHQKGIELIKNFSEI